MRRFGPLRNLGALRHLGPLLAAALLAAVRPALAAARPDEARRQAEAELAALAPRIEALKREGAAGRPAAGELERLLARAQELAAVIERLDRARGEAAPRHLGPDAQELRERADALRDRADRLAASLAEADRRIAEARRLAELGERLEAVSAAGDLFAEQTPRRAGPQAAAGPATVAAGRPADAAAPPSPSGVASARAAAGVDALAPAPGDALPVLVSKRAQMARALAAARAQAEALEAEARAAETAR